MTDIDNRRSVPRRVMADWQATTPHLHGDRLPPRHEPLTSYRTLTLPATPESLLEIGPWVSASLAALDSPLAARVSEIELALHELATSIVGRARRPESSTTEGQTYSITLVKFDDGVANVKAIFADDFAPLAGPAVPHRRTEPVDDGIALSVVLRLASSVAYEQVKNINQWTLVFRCPTMGASQWGD